jgi:hypothetical protein
VADKVGIGTSSPRYNLAVSGNNATAMGIALDNASGSGTADISILGAGYASHQAGAGEVWFYSPDNINIGGATGNTNNIKFLANNKINMFIEGSSGSVGIGTSSPSFGLSVESDNGSGYAALFRKSSSDPALTIQTTGGVTQIQGLNSALNATHGIAMQASGGNVGIGTSSPRYNAEISSSGSTFLQIASTSTSALTGLLFGDTSNAVGRVTYDHSNNSLAFFTNTTEKMRVTSAGDFLVGKSDTAFGTAGVEINQNGVAGKVFMTRSGGDPLSLNRLSSDGELIGFYKDTVQVGIIGAATGDLTIGTGDTGLTFEDAADVIHPINAGTGAARDDAIDLGKSAARFDDIYATNGTIQTSDRNEKQDIEELSDAEQRVAVACKGLLRKFRWKSSVEEKGDDARIHFGIIAQDLQDAFTAEGLDAGRYGMFINSTWTDEETGEERSRMGVRYSELLAFIISAI